MKQQSVELQNDFVQMPVTSDDYPHVTIPMIIDELIGMGIPIVHEAPKPRRTFRWYRITTSLNDSTLHDDSRASVSASSKDDTSSDRANSELLRGQATPEEENKFGVKELLYICTAETAEAVLSLHKKIFACVVVEKDDPLTFLEENSARCFVVSTTNKASVYEVIYAIKALFLQMLVWERSLEIITLKGSSLSEMLEVSIPILKNYLFASDHDANVIAYVSNMEPPDELHRQIINNKFLSPKMLKDLRPRTPQGEFCTFEADGENLYSKVTYPIYIECSYTGSISMSCNNRKDTKGLRDQFKILCDYCMPFFRKLWVNQISTNSPSFFFFNRLLEGDTIDEKYLETRKDALGLTTMNRYKLVILDLDVNFDVPRLKRVKKACSKVNGGKVHVFPYRDKLLMLLYGSVSDDQLEHVNIMQDIKANIFDPFNIQASISSIFYNITELNMAYQQALIAFQYRPAIMRARFADDNYNNEALVTFEAALMYYLIDDVKRDEQFVRFAFSSSVPNTLYREDLENGTNHLSILWCYLYNERNATAVAELLHMHRNTVLYNIQKIEQRFGLDLDDKTVRDWILLGFRYLVLNTESKILDSSLVIGS